MAFLPNIRYQLQGLRTRSADPGLKAFVPKGCLGDVFKIDTVIQALDEAVFNVPAHKRETTARIVLDEAPKVFAILLELHWEQSLITFIENDILDSRLPLDEIALQRVIPNAAKAFQCLQYEYLAYQFRRGQYHKKLSEQQILPYIQQKKIGGGGFSTVYKVRVHSSHQNFMSNPSHKVINLIRKELKPFSEDEKAEAELLFLLGSLRHPNIVELLASYTQNNISNLLFHPADMDLHDFLLQFNRPTGFTETYTFHQAMHGVADGLNYLHSFRARPSDAMTVSEVSMYGYHHDIKPKNILVRGTDFVLADFGTAKIKQLGDDSKTPWKNTTFEYGAPECRDSESFAVGVVGRALDIWSLACVFSEVVTYAERGSQGVIDFRQRRLKDHQYGQLRCFHDDGSLDQSTSMLLDDLEEQTSSSSTQKILSVIRKMFATEPADRVRADEVEKSFAYAGIEALLDAVVERVQNIIDTMKGATDQNLYTTRLKIETNRLLAWSGAMGIKPVSDRLKPFGEQVLVFFPDFCETLRSVIFDLSIGVSFDNTEDTYDFVLGKLQHMNNHLCKRLSQESRISIDNMFLINIANMANLQSLEIIRSWENIGSLRLISAEPQLQFISAEQNDNIGTGTAIKYMTLLLQKQSRERITNHRIEAPLVKTDDSEVNLLERPQKWFYSQGYQPGEERKVIVEIMRYGLKQHDVKSEDFRTSVETKFSRAQDLVELLQIKPIPPEFRILDCLGAFHDPQKASFGIVYGFPSEDTVPIRLNKLLRHGKRGDFYPDLSQKLHLAKALVACVQSFHTFGWLHKNISSLNVLFFQDPAHDLASLEFGKPYMVGFDHSRRYGDSEYSENWSHSQLSEFNTDFMKASKEYLHPDYRPSVGSGKRESGFLISYDYYAVGLLLLEIGTWGSLSNIYKSPQFQNLPPRDLQQEYIKYCDKHVGRAMGPIFQRITRRCLEYDGERKNHVAEQLRFQTEVVDELNKCVF